MKLRLFTAILCTVAQTALAQAADKTATCVIVEPSGFETEVTSYLDGALWSAGGDPSIIGAIQVFSNGSFRLNVVAYGTQDQLTFSTDTSAVLPNSRLQVSCKVR